MKRTHTVLLAATILLLSTAGAASAQGTNVPDPDTGDLGFGSEDVRDEPDHPDDDNGFQPAPDGADFWSPATETLVLESYYADTVAGTFNNYVNQLVHGDAYGNYDQYIIPGEANFPAYWGWWADTGSGGDLRNHSTSETALASDSGDGAIQDNDDDCRTDEWDEFVWRGVNNCAAESRQHDSDALWVFAQPGTWDGNVNGAAALLNDGDDAAEAADFRLEDITGGGDGPWRMPNGFGRITYDQSLLITSELTTSANPTEIDASKQLYKPHDADAVDVDTYSALSSQLEQVYRVTIWDPHEHDDSQGDTGSPVDDAVNNDEGPKEAMKEQGVGLVTDTARPALDAYWNALDATQRPRGAVENTAGKRPDTHEPNTAEDAYVQGNEYASFDAATSYGGLDGQYYEPGPDQTYTGYQDGAHTWVDAQQEWAVPFWGGIYGVNSYNFHLSTNDATGQSQDEHNTQSPGLLHQRLFVGLWHDKNGDTWVGDVTNKQYDPEDEPVGRQSSLLIPYERWYDASKGSQSEDNPYAGGTDSDPNNYWNETEWKGIDGEGNVDITVKLVPQTEGQTWGETGVYVFRDPSNPYGPAVSDVAGNSTDPVADPLRDHDTLGGIASYTYPEDDGDRLSNYVRQGPIELATQHVTAVGHDGHFRTEHYILFPTGTLDYEVKSTVVVENKDTGTTGSGSTAGQDLAGEVVKDVDIIDSMT